MYTYTHIHIYISIYVCVCVCVIYAYFSKTMICTYTFSVSVVPLDSSLQPCAHSIIIRNTCIKPMHKYRYDIGSIYTYICI